jgi:hypothetical protein
MTKESAAQVALELALNECGNFTTRIPLCCFGNKGSEMIAHDAVQNRAHRFPALVAKVRTGRTT